MNKSDIKKGATVHFKWKGETYLGRVSQIELTFRNKRIYEISSGGTMFSLSENDIIKIIPPNQIFKLKTMKEFKNDHNN